MNEHVHLRFPIYLPSLLVYLFAHLLASLADEQYSVPKIEEKNLDDAFYLEESTGYHCFPL